MNVIKFRLLPVDENLSIIYKCIKLVFPSAVSPRKKWNVQGNTFCNFKPLSNCALNLQGLVFISKILNKYDHFFSDWEL